MNAPDVGLHLEVMTFYARQMRRLDALDIDGYVATFTDDGVVDHAHRGERIAGRGPMAANARAALPRYANAAVRHWNDHYLVEPLGADRIAVSYCSLVTRTDADGRVTFEPTFFVEDVLRRVDGALLTESRTIFRDQPTTGSPAPATLEQTTLEQTTLERTAPPQQTAPQCAAPMGWPLTRPLSATGGTQ